MRLYKHGSFAVVEKNSEYFQSPELNWNLLINRKDLCFYIDKDSATWRKIKKPKELGSEPPISNQEIWAAGVTYLRSKMARMDEAKQAGGGDFYDRVYEARRPELFFKATGARTAGNRGTVNIRKDSSWNVPEPELTLFINTLGSIEAYTIGNDMSSRSIEGENPLYLPQAKVYDFCAGMGPCLYLSPSSLPMKTIISMWVVRNKKVVFKNEVSIDRIKRKFTELVEYLYRECSFPAGCFLMTGTGIVPPDDFTLIEEDEIHIKIDPIGTLINFVGIRRDQIF